MWTAGDAGDGDVEDEQTWESGTGCGSKLHRRTRPAKSRFPSKDVYGTGKKSSVSHRSLYLLKEHLQIEHLGTVIDIKRDEGGCTLTIGDSAPILGDCHTGDSIAVNGACLTVVEFDKEQKGGWFTVWLANETLDRTDLGAQWK